MDKNIIKQYLTKTFIAEAKEEVGATPAIKLAGKLAKDNKKINTDGVKEIGKDMKGYDAEAKVDSEAKTMAPNKFNYNDKKEVDYHEQMEIMNGQEMIQYDREPNKDFTERALEAIEGSSRMGNNPEWANVVAKGDGGDPEFGKNLVKKIRASQDKRTKQTPTTKMYGDDWEVVKDENSKDYAFEGEIKKPVVTEAAKLGKGYTHFLVFTGNGKIVDGWDYKGLDLDEIKHWVKIDMKDNDYYGQDKKAFKLVTKQALIKKGIDVSDQKNWFTERFNDTPAAPAAPSQPEPMAETTQNNKPQIKESMKRLKFKKEFNGVGNALKLIPEAYKVDKTVFEMTDGNEKYRIRWEGTVNEGKAEILLATDKTMVNENIEKMKHLFNYKPEATLGLVKGKARINENDVFTEMRKRLLESEDIEGQTADKEAPFEEADIKQAADAKKHVEGSVSKDKGTKAPAPKKAGDLDDAVDSATEATEHIEGSVSTEKGTKAPAPKTGKWEEISVPQAADAKKHITMNEEEEIGDDDDDVEMPKKKRADAYDASLDVDSPDDKADNLSKKDIESGSKPETFINKDLDATDDEEDDEMPAPAAPVSQETSKLVRSKTSGQYGIMMKNNGKVEIIDMPEKYLDMYKEQGAKAVIMQIKSDKRRVAPSEMSDSALMEELDKMIQKKK